MGDQPSKRGKRKKEKSNWDNCASDQRIRTLNKEKSHKKKPKVHEHKLVKTTKDHALKRGKKKKGKTALPKLVGIVDII